MNPLLDAQREQLLVKVSVDAEAPQIVLPAE